MKKLFAVLLILILTANILTSCSKEEESTNRVGPKEKSIASETEPEEERDTAKETDKPKKTQALTTDYVTDPYHDKEPEAVYNELVTGDWFHTESDMSFSFDGKGNCVRYSGGEATEATYLYDGTALIIYYSETDWIAALFNNDRTQFMLSATPGAFMLAKDDNVTSPIDITEKEEQKPAIDPTPFYGCWKMEELDVWYIIDEDGTYTFVALYGADEFEQDGPYSFEVTDKGLYLPEYLTELTYNDGKLTDSDGNIYAVDEIFDPVS